MRKFYKCHITYSFENGHNGDIVNTEKDLICDDRYIYDIFGNIICNLELDDIKKIILDGECVKGLSYEKLKMNKKFINNFIIGNNVTIKNIKNKIKEYKKSNNFLKNIK
jgi:hypothetical protein